MPITARIVPLDARADEADAPPAILAQPVFADGGQPLIETESRTLGLVAALPGECGVGVAVVAIPRKQQAELRAADVSAREVHGRGAEAGLKATEVAQQCHGRPQHQPAADRCIAPAAAPDIHAGDQLHAVCHVPAALQLQSADEQPAALAGRRTVDRRASPPGVVDLEQQAATDQAHGLAAGQAHALDAQRGRHRQTPFRGCGRR